MINDATALRLIRLRLRDLESRDADFDALHDLMIELQSRVAVKGDQGPRGPAGEAGPRGEAGPIGPAPAHQWDGSKLRFQEPDGTWGEWTDLRGPRGYPGGGGAVEAAVAAPTFSYFPGGWN